LAVVLVPAVSFIDDIKPLSLILFQKNKELKINAFIHIAGKAHN
jgi:hypothetical protein